MSEPRVAPPVGLRAGRLVVVGTGIRAIAQITLEALAHIEAADIVFTGPCDPVTHRFLRTKSRNFVDVLDVRPYAPDEERRRTYREWALAMLREVRRGRYVVGAFYGHPGVFANPTHWAVATARTEGYDAVMLPGVSAEDCLYADLGLDPATPGCRLYEATALLWHGQPLNTDCHVILFQVGMVANVSGMRPDAPLFFDHPGFAALVERLAQAYGEDHPVVHYVAAVIPGSRPIRERYRIGELRDPEVAQRLLSISTFYLPPRTGPVSAPAATTDPTPARPATRTSPASVPTAAQARPRVSSAMFEALRDLALDPGSLQQFEREPEAFFALRPGLTGGERDAIASRDPWRMYREMQRSAAEVAASFVRRIGRSPALAAAYANAIEVSRGRPDARASLCAWLREQGHDVDLEDLDTAFAATNSQAEAEEASLASASTFEASCGTYRTYRRCGTGRFLEAPALSVGGTPLVPSVVYDGQPIAGVAYANGALSWRRHSGSPARGSLWFHQGPDAAPRFVGRLWDSGPELSSEPDFVGHRDGLADPEAAASWSSAEYLRRQLPLERGLGAAAIRAGSAAAAAADALARWIADPSNESRQALATATEAADHWLVRLRRLQARCVLPAGTAPSSAAVLAGLVEDCSPPGAGPSRPSAEEA